MNFNCAHVYVDWEIARELVNDQRICCNQSNDHVPPIGWERAAQRSRLSTKGHWHWSLQALIFWRGARPRKARSGKAATELVRAIFDWSRAGQAGGLAPGVELLNRSYCNGSTPMWATSQGLRTQVIEWASDSGDGIHRRGTTPKTSTTHNSEQRTTLTLWMSNVIKNSRSMISLMSMEMEWLVSLVITLLTD